MLKRTGRQHTIDFIFPIALLFVFAASSLVVLLLSANIYREITIQSENNYNTGTALSYIVEKIRKNDLYGENGVFLDSFDGCKALVLKQEYGEDHYCTYIYESEGMLKELFIKEGTQAKASSGNEIMKVHSFEMEEIDGGVFKLKCITKDGEEEDTIVKLRSVPLPDEQQAVKSETKVSSAQGEITTVENPGRETASISVQNTNGGTEAKVEEEEEEEESR